MLAYIVRRLLWTPIVLLVITVTTFALGLYGPGDPIELLLGQHANPEVVARIRHERGLDRPFPEQYLNYMLGVVTRLDFGESLRYRGQPVLELMLPRMWVSAQLGIVVIFLTVIIALPLGIVAAVKQGNWLDTTIVSFTLLFYATPVFVTAPLLVLILVRQWHLLPSAGWGGIFDLRIIMPAVVMSLGSLAGLARLMRASTLEVIGQDYIRTARAKGLMERVVLGRHVARNALLPIFTVLGLSLATLVEGAFITETLFGIPGMGRLAVDSFFNRDYPVIMALTMIIAIGYVIANLVVDVGYTFLDPRIRYR